MCWGNCRGGWWTAAAWWLERRKNGDYARHDKLDMQIDIRKEAERLAAEQGLDADAAADPAAKAPSRFWLQAGSFAMESDAENLKARLALAGWEAQVQQGQVPDKGVRYRVRLGPYDNTDELNRIKGELARRGFDVAVIRY